MSLVTLLNQVQEGDKTLLDNSAVMWLPELADGNALQHEQPADRDCRERRLAVT